MATFTKLDQEKLDKSDKHDQRKVNTLGSDRPVIEEPFGLADIVLREDLFNVTPTASTSFASPDYGDWPLGHAFDSTLHGDVAARRIKARLHPLVTSGMTGPSSIQTFVVVSAPPASDSFEDIEAVRIKHLVPPDLSLGRTNASDPDPNFRGFEMALFPAQTGPDGLGNALDGYDGYGAIPTTADPSAVNGMGDAGRWTVDYANGIVRFTEPPLNGQTGLMNPFNVYGDINGQEVTSASGGRITMFATFYQYVGSTGIRAFGFATVGDGVVSFGLFTGNTSGYIQTAINSLPSEGGTVFVKEGVYSSISTITIPENVTVLGLGNAILSPAGDHTKVIVTGGNSGISNMFISSGSNGGALIEVGSIVDSQSINDVNIENNTLLCTNDAYGVKFSPSNLNVSYNNIKVDGNSFRAETAKTGVAWVNVTSNGSATPGTIILTASENASTWTENTVTVGSDILAPFDVAYDGFNLWVAVGQNATTGEMLILTSENGTDWTNRSHGIAGTQSLGSVTYAGSRWVTVSTSGIILTSSDGITWAQSTTDSPGGSWNDVVYDGKETIVAVGQSPAFRARIAVSRDSGSTWVSVPGIDNFQSLYGVSGFQTVAHNKIDTWMVQSNNSGSIFTSHDGYMWDKGGDTGFNLLASLIYGDGTWVAMGSSQLSLVFSKDNGVTWSAPQAIPTSGAAISMAYNGVDKWVISAQGAAVDVEIFSSPDLISWTKEQDILLSGAGDYEGNEVAHRNFSPTYIGEGIADGYGYIKNLSISDNTFQSTGIDDAKILLDGLTVESMTNVVISGNNAGAKLSMSKKLKNIKLSDNSFDTVEMSNISSLSTIGDATLADGEFKDVVFSNNNLLSLDLKTGATLEDFVFDGNNVLSGAVFDGYMTESTVSDNRFGHVAKFNQPLTNVLIDNNSFDGYGVSLVIPATTTNTTISNNKMLGTVFDRNSIPLDITNLLLPENSVQDDGYGIHTGLKFVGNTMRTGFSIFSGTNIGSYLGPILNSTVSGNVLSYLTISNFSHAHAVANSSISDNIIDSRFAPNISFLTKSGGIRILHNVSSGGPSTAAVFNSSISNNTGSTSVVSLTESRELSFIDIIASGNTHACENSIVSENIVGSMSIDVSAPTTSTSSTVEGSKISGNVSNAFQITNAGTSVVAVLNSSVNENKLGLVTIGGMSSSNFSDNNASGLSTTAPVSNSTISDNQIFGSSGIAMTNASAIVSATLFESIVSGNVFASATGDLSITNSGVAASAVDSSSILDNTVGQHLTIDGTTASSAVTYSVINGNYLGGNLSVTVSSAGSNAVNNSTVSNNRIGNMLFDNTVAAATAACVLFSVISSNNIDGTLGFGPTVTGTGLVLDRSSLLSNVITGVTTFANAAKDPNDESVTGTSITGNKFVGAINFSGKILQSNVSGNNIAGAWTSDIIDQSSVSGNTFIGIFTTGSASDTAVFGTNQSTVSSNQFSAAVDLLGRNISLEFAGNEVDGILSFSITGASSCTNVCNISNNVLSQLVMTGPVSNSSILNNAITNGIAITNATSFVSPMLGNSIVSGNTIAGATADLSVSNSGIAGKTVVNSIISGNDLAQDLIIDGTTSAGAVNNSVISGNFVGRNLTVSINASFETALEGSMVSNNKIVGNLLFDNLFATTGTVCVTTSTISSNSIGGTLGFGPTITGTGLVLDQSLLLSNFVSSNITTFANAAKSVGSGSVTGALISGNNFSGGTVTVSGTTGTSVISDNVFAAATFTGTVSGSTLSTNRFAGALSLPALSGCVVSDNVTGSTTGITSMTLSAISGNNFGVGTFIVSGTTGTSTVSNNYFGSTAALSGASTDVVLMGNIFSSTLTSVSFTDSIVYGNSLGGDLTIDASGGTCLSNSMLLNNMFDILASRSIQILSTAGTANNCVNFSAICGNVLSSIFIAQAVTTGSGILVFRSAICNNQVAAGVTIGNTLRTVTAQSYQQSVFAGNVGSLALRINGSVSESSLSGNYIFGALTISRLVESSLSGNTVRGTFNNGLTSDVTNDSSNNSIISSNYFKAAVNLRGRNAELVVSGNDIVGALVFSLTGAENCLSSCNISGNKVVSISTTGPVLNSTISDNQILGSGGIVMTNTAAQPASTLLDSIVSGNVFTSATGDLSITNSGVVATTVVGSTISNNTVGQDIVIDGTTTGAAIANSIVQGNISTLMTLTTTSATLSTIATSIVDGNVITSDLGVVCNAGLTSPDHCILSSLITNNSVAGDVNIAVALLAGSAQAINTSSVSGNVVTGTLAVASLSRSPGQPSVGDVVVSDNVINSVTINGRIFNSSVHGNFFVTSFFVDSIVNVLLLENLAGVDITIGVAALDAFSKVLNSSVTGNWATALDIEGRVEGSIISSNMSLGGVTISTIDSGHGVLLNSVFSNNYMTTCDFDNVQSTATAVSVLDNSTVSGNTMTGAFTVSAAGTGLVNLLNSSSISGNHMKNNLVLTNTTATRGTIITNSKLDGNTIVGSLIASTADADVNLIDGSSIINNHISTNIDFDNTDTTTGTGDVIINSVIGSNYVGGTFGVNAGATEVGLISGSIISSNVVVGAVTISNDDTVAGSSSILVLSSSISLNIFGGLEIHSDTAGTILSQVSIIGNQIDNLNIFHDAVGGVCLGRASIIGNSFGGTVATIGSATLTSTMQATVSGNNFTSFVINASALSELAKLVVVGNVGNAISANATTTTPDDFTMLGNQFATHTNITYSGTAPTWTTMNAV